MDDTCLRRENASHAHRQVRVISLDRDAPAVVPLPQAAQQAPKAGKNPSKGSTNSQTTDRQPR